MASYLARLTEVEFYYTIDDLLAKQGELVFSFKGIECRV